MTIEKEFILFMENKVRGVKSYTNIEGTEILVLDPNNFYHGDVKLFKSELKSDLISAALLRCEFGKIAEIEKQINGVKLSIII